MHSRANGTRMTKSRSPAGLEEGQVKHPFRPLDERAAAASAGRFGSRQIVSVEEAQKWCRTEASESVRREARQ
jgi:hypothetical protein